MDILNFILGLQQQRRQQQQMGILNDILGQTMAGQQGMPGINIPSDMPTDIYSPFYNPTTGGMEGRPSVPKGTPEEIQDVFINTILKNPGLSLESKIRGFQISEMLNPQKKESKRHVLKEGDTLVDDKGNVIAEGPAKKEKPKLITVSPGQKIVDEEGKVKFEMPEKLAEAPKTREYKKGGELVTEEWDAEAKKWKPVAKAPREIEKPDEIATKDKKQIDIWTSAINTTLKKYGPIGEGLLISVGEGFDWSSAKNAYEKMKGQADKGDPKAKTDLDRVDDWVEKISKTAGLPKGPANDPLGIRRR